MFGTKVLSSRYLYFPSHEPPILLFLRFKRHFVWQRDKHFFQGSNVLTPEGVATVWNISQVRFEDWTKAHSYNSYFEKLDWKFYMNQRHILVKLQMKKNFSAVKTGQNTGGGRLGGSVQAYHYLSGLAVDHHYYQLHHNNHPPIYWHQFQS